MGKVGIHRNFDGDYTAKSNVKKATFRLIVHQGRGKEYLAKGTNLDVNRSIRTMMNSIALVLWERRLIPEFVA